MSLYSTIKDLRHLLVDFLASLIVLSVLWCGILYWGGLKHMILGIPAAFFDCFLLLILGASIRIIETPTDDYRRLVSRLVVIIYAAAGYVRIQQGAIAPGQYLFSDYPLFLAPVLGFFLIFLVHLAHNSKIMLDKGRYLFILVVIAAMLAVYGLTGNAFTVMTIAGFILLTWVLMTGTAISPDRRLVLMLLLIAGLLAFSLIAATLQLLRPAVVIPQLLSDLVLYLTLGILVLSGHPRASHYSSRLLHHFGNIFFPDFLRDVKKLWRKK